MPKPNGGDAQRTRFLKGTESPPTLADLGISKKQSSRWQRLADMDENEFEAHTAGVNVAMRKEINQ
jgi:hypothetical protein